MNNFGTKCLTIIFLIVLSLITPTVTIVKSIKFDQKCGGYLKQTADANTIDLAAKRLDVAIKYAEDNHLTNGYTSVLWKTEDENIGFWYDNLIACQTELNELIDNPNATQLEKSNVLMKVRESLTDNGAEGGTQLTVPMGISRYPKNALFGILNTISVILLIFSIILMVNWRTDD